MKKKKMSVEIVHATPVQTDVRALLDRLVKERVDEIMSARNAERFVPDCQPRETSYEIQRRQTVFERHKWALYFERWGCRVCGRKKNVSHASGGNCSACHLRIFARLKRIEREYQSCNPEAAIEESIDLLTRRYRSAEALLRSSKIPAPIRPVRAPNALTDREQEVMDLVRQGCRDSEMAEKLRIGEKTVQSHLYNALRKLGIRHRRDLLQDKSEKEATK